MGKLKRLCNKFNKSIGEGRGKDDFNNTTFWYLNYTLWYHAGKKIPGRGSVGGGGNEKKRKLAYGISILKFYFVLFLVEMSNGHLNIFGPETQIKSMCQKYKFKSHWLMTKYKILCMDQIT